MYKIVYRGRLQWLNELPVKLVELEAYEVMVIHRNRGLIPPAADALELKRESAFSLKRTGVNRFWHADLLKR